MTPLPEPVDHYPPPRPDDYDSFGALRGIALGIVLGSVVWGTVWWAGRAWGCW